MVNSLAEYHCVVDREFILGLPGPEALVRQARPHQPDEADGAHHQVRADRRRRQGEVPQGQVRGVGQEVATAPVLREAADGGRAEGAVGAARASAAEVEQLPRVEKDRRARSSLLEARLVRSLSAAQVKAIHYALLSL